MLAHERDQKYKEGKFIIEKYYLQKQLIGDGLLANNQDCEAVNLNDNLDQMSHFSDEENVDHRSSRYFFRSTPIAQSGTIDLASILPSIRGSILRQALGLEERQSSQRIRQRGEPEHEEDDIQSEDDQILEVDWFRQAKKNWNQLDEYGYATNIDTHKRLKCLRIIFYSLIMYH